MCSVNRKAENNKKWPNGDGPSENEQKSEMKEITKVASTFFFAGVEANFSLQHQRWVPGACCSHIL